MTYTFEFARDREREREKGEEGEKYSHWVESRNKLCQLNCRMKLNHSFASTKIYLTITAHCVMCRFCKAISILSLRIRDHPAIYVLIYNYEDVLFVRRCCCFLRFSNSILTDFMLYKAFSKSSIISSSSILIVTI